MYFGAVRAMRAVRYFVTPINCTAYKHLLNTVNCIHGQKTDSGVVASIFLTAGLHFTTLPVEIGVMIYGMSAVTWFVASTNQHHCAFLIPFYFPHFTHRRQVQNSRSCLELRKHKEYTVIIKQLNITSMYTLPQKIAICVTFPKFFV